MLRKHACLVWYLPRSLGLASATALQKRGQNVSLKLVCPLQARNYAWKTQSAVRQDEFSPRTSPRTPPRTPPGPPVPPPSRCGHQTRVPRRACPRTRHGHPGRPHGRSRRRYLRQHQWGAGPQGAGRRSSGHRSNRPGRSSAGVEPSGAHHRRCRLLFMC